LDSEWFAANGDEHRARPASVRRWQKTTDLARVRITSRWRRWSRRFAGRGRDSVATV